MIKRLATEPYPLSQRYSYCGEPSLTEPQPVDIKYNVIWPNISDVPMNDEPFETKEEALDFILDDLGLAVVEVKPKK